MERVTKVSDVKGGDVLLVKYEGTVVCLLYVCSVKSCRDYVCELNVCVEYCNMTGQGEYAPKFQDGCDAVCFLELTPLDVNKITIGRPHLGVRFWFFDSVEKIPYKQKEMVKVLAGL